MSLEDRMLSVLLDSSGVSKDRAAWDVSLSDLGMDSLDILDFLYSLEREFRLPKLADGSLLTDKTLTLNAIRLQILSKVVQPASAE
jgi:acyl carrier protein